MTISPTILSWPKIPKPYPKHAKWCSKTPVRSPALRKPCSVITLARTKPYTGTGASNVIFIFCKNEAGRGSDYDSITREEVHGAASSEGETSLQEEHGSGSSNIEENVTEEEPITPLTISVMLFLTLAFIGQVRVFSTSQKFRNFLGWWKNTPNVSASDQLYS